MQPSCWEVTGHTCSTVSFKRHWHCAFPRRFGTTGRMTLYNEDIPAALAFLSRAEMSFSLRWCLFLPQFGHSAFILQSLCSTMQQCTQYIKPVGYKHHIIRSSGTRAVSLLKSRWHLSRFCMTALWHSHIAGKSPSRGTLSCAAWCTPLLGVRRAYKFWSRNDVHSKTPQYSQRTLNSGLLHDLK